MSRLFRRLLRSVGRRWRGVGVFAAVGALVAVGLVRAASPGGRSLLPGARLISGAAPACVNTQNPNQFCLSGTVAGLIPGVGSSLVLTAGNSYSVPITVNSVTVAVPSAPAGCPLSNLMINGTNFAGTSPSVTVSGLSLLVPANQTATVSLPILVAKSAPNGCQSVTFQFNYTGSASYTEPTVTSLQAAPNPSSFNQSVTFTATVAPNVTPSSAGVTPVGSVTFYQCNSPANLASGSPASACTASAALSPAVAVTGSGQATYSTSALTVGSHAVFAVYAPTDSTSFVASSSTTVTQVVNRASTSTMLTSTPNPSRFGQAVTVTAQVSPSPGPTGTVSFYLCPTSACSSTFLLGTAPLNAAGQASVTTSILPPGADNLEAVYGGDTNYLGSTSAAATQTVTFTSPCITKTINGGFVVSLGQAICISGRVNGTLTVLAGGAIVLDGATINGGVTTTGALAVRICGSNIEGNVAISGTVGFVSIGDGGDDGPPGCSANTITGSVTLSGNQAGFELAANQVSLSVSVSANLGTGPTPEDRLPEIEGNRIGGSLACATSNNPAVTDGSQKNTVTGARSGQCSAAGF